MSTIAFPPLAAGPDAAAAAAAQAGAPLRPQTSVRGAVMSGLLALALLVLGLGGASALVGVSGAVVAPGLVALQGRAKTVQHLDGGIVREIRVRNGSTVSQGETLLRLDDTRLLANAEMHGLRLREGLARLARLQAERDGRGSIDWSAASLPALAGWDDSALAAAPEQHQAQQRLFELRRAARGGRGAQQTERIKQLEAQIAGVQGLMAARSQQLSSIGGELTDLRALLKEGFISAPRVLQLEREQSALAGQLAEHRAELARLANGIEEARIGRLQSEREFQEQVQAELRQLTVELNDSAQQYRTIREQLARVEIRAPEAGVVHELAVSTVGGVIAPGALLMQIVAPDGMLVVEANVEAAFIDQVRAGQEAVVRFPAAARDQTPELPATVVSVSPTSVVDERSGAVFYRAEIHIARDQIERMRVGVVMPGVPVEVYLRTGERSILSYLTRPLTDQFQRALREK